MTDKVLSAGIIAAGDGSRLKSAGIREHKPLVKVAGYPLIGHTLRRLKGIGVKKVALIFNEQEQSCVDWVKANFPDFDLQIIVKSTKSSFESFWRVGRALGPGRHLISTVDSICSIDELKKMAEQGASDPSAVYLGVTAFVDDEKPLWVEMREQDYRITALGGAKGNFATAGFYNVPDRIFKSQPVEEMKSLRFFLKWLVEKDVPVFGVPLAKVVDVDSPKDIEEAEKLLGKEKEGAQV